MAKLCLFYNLLTPFDLLTADFWYLYMYSLHLLCSLGSKLLSSRYLYISISIIISINERKSGDIRELLLSNYAICLLTFTTYYFNYFCCIYIAFITIVLINCRLRRNSNVYDCMYRIFKVN